MVNRFVGTEARRRLIDALLNCQLIKHDKELAGKLAETGEVVEFKKDDVIMSEGEDDNDIYFILAGEVEVSIKKNIVAVRKAGDVVGEMAIVNPSEPRSATLKALGSGAVALKVTEPEFTRIADEYPHIWKSIANVATDRLRQRSKFITTPNEDPVLFIGCSTESLEIAEEIQLGLKHAKVEVVIWTNGVFTASDVVIDKLQTIVNETDFAVFVFSEDDKVESRKVEYNAPRDNTIFELGLFMGKLERGRTFIVKEHNSDVKIPSDLLGITELTYVVKKRGNLTAALSTVCTEIRKVIRELGAR
jgi:predicted nucleotide-binding protein